MRMLGRRLDMARDDRGMTLVEVMVAFFLIAIVTTGLGLIITNGLRTQALTERTDRITGITQLVMSKARQVDFAQLGYYTADGVTAGNVTVPVSPITSGTVGPSVTEARVILGSTRPPATTPFTTPVQSINNDAGVNYRITTHVTWVPDPLGGTPTAKRVTITTQWAPHPTALTGNCSQANTRCTTNSFIRTATASDMDPVTGNSPTTTCTPGAAVICEAYVRAGRVLDGATMVSSTDVPQQAEPVDLYVRTASTATAVTATWQWHNAAGTVVRTVTKALTGGGDGTRWTAEVTPDTTGTSSAYKGDIRPGVAKVTFTATIGGSPVTVQRDVFWSYAAADGADTVSATIVSATNWCSPVGAGQPVTVTVQGHSIGFTANTQNPSAKDRVDIVFTTTTGGVTRTETVPAAVVPGSVVANNQTEHGVVTGGWVNANWTAAPPATEHCDSRSVSVVVHRAIDATTTPIVLPLPGTTPVVPALPAPTLSVNSPATSSSFTLTWTAPVGATAYILEVTKAGTATEVVNTTALTYTGTLLPGQSVTARVKATSQWSTSPWSNTGTGQRAPAQPVVTGVRAADKVTFSWPAVPYATQYIVDTIAAGVEPTATRVTQSGTSLTRSIERGQAVHISVWAVTGGVISTAGSAVVTAPAWETPALQNGWTNYGGAHRTAVYTRTSEDVIVLSGLIKGGATANGTVLFNLPPGYRPGDGKLIFSAASNGTNTARVDVATNGDVILQAGEAADSTWISLAGITFLPADHEHTSRSVTLTPTNGWANYGNGYAPLNATMDRLGRVHTVGLASVGTRGTNGVVANLPAGYTPPNYLHLPTNSANVFSEMGVDGALRDKGIGSVWATFNGMWHTAANNAQFNPLTMLNGYANYGGTYQTAQYSKADDGMVQVRGLLTNGTRTSGTVVAQLPEDHRPAQTLIFTVAQNHHYTRVDVTAEGWVIAREGLSDGWLSLDGIAFMAEQ